MNKYTQIVSIEGKLITFTYECSDVINAMIHIGMDIMEYINENHDGDARWAKSLDLRVMVDGEKQRTI